MKILSLDPATNTGWAVVDADVQSGSAHCPEYGIISIPEALATEGEKCWFLYNAVKNLITKHTPDVVLVEDYFFGGTFASGAKENVAYRTVIHMVSSINNVRYEIINPSLWKSYVCGRTQPSKIQKAKWGKDKAKKYMIQDALWQKYGLRFPNHMLSEKNGKPIAPKSDYIDAVGFAIFYLFQFNVKTFTIVAPPPDAIIKGKTFVYEER